MPGDFEVWGALEVAICAPVLVPRLSPRDYVCHGRGSCASSTSSTSPSLNETISPREFASSLLRRHESRWLSTAAWNSWSRTMTSHHVSRVGIPHWQRLDDLTSSSSSTSLRYLGPLMIFLSSVLVPLLDAGSAHMSGYFAPPPRSWRLCTAVSHTTACRAGIQYCTVLFGYPNPNNSHFMPKIRCTKILYMRDLQSCVPESPSCGTLVQPHAPSLHRSSARQDTC
ncbi:hypothetical protein BCR34DRAFT_150344 [Clohesyomyces aquaticus]|uniref:Uncharacterized protein n=1 Tax=Clohesyomyces aquaticus TaxID=1231657 RepID=A0A1Y1YK81_9PLEO|nr:hypothetical protein BCR34DRAFT_150344 [Clohesyomyces aquaticus]